MKVAISSTGTEWDSPLDPRFGRCEYFFVVDTDTKEAETVKNPGASAYGGSGVSASQFVQDKGVDVVITGNVGPNAHRVLDAAGIRVIVGASGTVKRALDDLGKGLLKETARPTVPGHHGQGGR
ncbi:MAG: NifB/NifX family molybdenum-iron cluster-binding protein [Candidatus Thermoplasmatota archaeon]|nr:NifB/NifX family molybdenum-iron cluster-binding protein [Candidatus Thermoplasmatota archaeon]